MPNPAYEIYAAALAYCVGVCVGMFFGGAGVWVFLKLTGRLK